MKAIRLSLVAAFACLGALSASAGQPGQTQQLTAPDQTPEGLEKSDWASIRAAHTAWQHGFMPIEGGWQARNPGQQWTTRFDARGFLTTPKDGGWTWGLELQSYGVGEMQTPVAGQPAMKADGQRLTYQWDATLQEWWVNNQRGLEHGYTLAQRPTPTLNSQLHPGHPRHAYAEGRRRCAGRDLPGRGGSYGAQLHRPEGDRCRWPRARFALRAGGG